MSFQDKWDSTAEFSVVSGHLQVVLTSGKDASVPSDVLTAIFFSPNRNNLREQSAMLGAGSDIVGGPWIDPANFTGNVGSEWGYAAGTMPFGATAGISSTGLGIFGQGTFPTTYGNLDPPPNTSSPLDGMSFGIVRSLVNPNGGLESNAEIQSSVVFLFDLPTKGPAFNITELDNVTFFYGTDLNASVPEGGATAALLGLGLLGTGAVQRRLKRA